MRSILRYLSTEWYVLADPNYLHPVDGICATRYDRLFLAGIVDPDLAVQALTVPAEIGARDGVHSQELKTTEDGVVFRHEVAPAEDLDLDKAIVWDKDLRMQLHPQQFYASLR